MSNRRRKLPNYRVPEDDDLSHSVYLNANGDLMHLLFVNLPVAGVFEWEDSDGPQQDFFVEFKWEDGDNDDDDDDEYFF
jgi:hypothetical protein